MVLFRVTVLGLAAATLGACSNDSSSQPPAKPQTLAAAPAAPPVAPPGPQPANAAAIQSVDAAAYDPSVNTPPAAHAQASPVLIKAEVLLDRANFSPGVIDGHFGTNVHNAIAAYEAAHGMQPDGQLTPAVWQALTADKQSVLQAYVIAAEDVQGPFIGSLPAKFPAQAKLGAMGFLDAAQAIAEKFHMGEDLLKALNPGVDFSKAGTPIVVARPDANALPEPVTRVEVDKAHAAVRAFDASGRLIADYPATVGSTDKPSPSGDLKVARIDWNPTYHYDPKQLHFAKVNYRFDIQPGPNNPVGVVWIALSKPTYGIHGAPSPQNIGKTASHGCVRLTNWDAVQLAHAVAKGVEVVFINQRPGTPTKLADATPRSKGATRSPNDLAPPAPPEPAAQPSQNTDNDPDYQTPPHRP